MSSSQTNSMSAPMSAMRRGSPNQSRLRSPRQCRWCRQYCRWVSRRYKYHRKGWSAWWVTSWDSSFFLFRFFSLRGRRQAWWPYIYLVGACFGTYKLIYLPWTSQSDHQHNLALELMRQTRLNYHYATQCLLDNGWDMNRGLEAFQRLRVNIAASGLACVWCRLAISGLLMEIVMTFSFLGDKHHPATGLDRLMIWQSFCWDRNG